MPNLDRSARWFDPQVAGHTHRFVGCAVDNRVEQRIVAQANALHPGAIVFQALKWPIGQIRPIARIGGRTIGRVQLSRVACDIERLDTAIAPKQGFTRRALWRRPALNCTADRLAKRIHSHSIYSTDEFVSNNSWFPWPVK